MQRDHSASQGDDSLGGDSLNVDEFLDLLARHEAQVMGFLWSISWTGEDAEELFQQTVITMWRQLTQFQRGDEFRCLGLPDCTAQSI